MGYTVLVVATQERVSGANGRRRFDANGENTFAYVNVLLYTQQFGEAVAFLLWKGHHLAVKGLTHR